MKRDFLKGMNLSDEQIDSILNSHSAAIGAEIAKTNAAREQINAMAGDLNTRDKDLAELRKAAEGNKDLQDRYANLEKQYKDAAGENQKAMQSALMRAALNVELSSLSHDIGIVSGLLDTAKITLDDNGMIKSGLKEQIESLQKDKPFLFKTETGAPSGRPPADASGRPPAPNDRAAWESKLSEARKLPNNLPAVIRIKQDAAQNGHILY